MGAGFGFGNLYVPLEKSWLRPCTGIALTFAFDSLPHTNNKKYENYLCSRVMYFRIYLLQSAMFMVLELCHSVGSFSNNNGGGNEDVKKAIGLLPKTSTLFCTFLYRPCTATTWKCLIVSFVEDVNTGRFERTIFNSTHHSNIVSKKRAFSLVSNDCKIVPTLQRCVAPNIVVASRPV